MSALQRKIRENMNRRAADADVVVIVSHGEKGVWAIARANGIPFRLVFPFVMSEYENSVARFKRLRFSNDSMFIGEWGVEEALRELFPAGFAMRDIDAEVYEEEP